MGLIPNIFGKGDRYIGLLPLSFWIDYSFINDYSFFSILQIIIGMSFVIPQIYRDIFEERIKEGKIKNTRDFSNFIKEKPLLFLSGVLIYPYYIGTVIFGFFTKKDASLFFLLVVNILGFVYVIFTLILRPDIRQKILEIKDFLMKCNKK